MTDGRITKACAATRPPLMQRKHQQTRQRIVEVAVDLFTKRGFDAVTTDEIADAADCSRSTLFRYFGGKEDILFLGVHEQLAQVRDELAGLQPCADPWTAAKEIGIARFVDFLSGESALPRECVALWFTHPALLSHYLHVNHQWERMLAEFFATARHVAPEADVDSQLRASALCGVVRAVFRAYSRPETDLHVAIAAALATVENGFHSQR